MIVIIVLSAISLVLIYLIVSERKRNSQLKEKIEALRIQWKEREHAIAIVSHDLKGPLNRIYALINLLELSGISSNSQYAEYLNKMNQVVKEGMMLIKNILDLQKMESGETSLNISKIELSALINEQVSDYRQQAKYKSVEFRFSPEKEYWIGTDRIYLIRMIDNLLSNALKFSRIGGVVEVGIEDEDERIKVLVWNEGEQIEEKEIDSLFHKYSQLSVKPTLGESSSGIGLAIVQMIANILNYQVKYEPWADKGSIFIVEIPKEEGSLQSRQ